MPRFLRRLLLTAAAMLLLAPRGSPGAAPSSDLPSFREALLARINQFRVAHDRARLEVDSRLEAASQEWAERLAVLRRLQHRSDDSLSSLLEAGGWETINENLYYSSSSPDPERILADWEKSPFHRKNLLNPVLRFAGLGRASASGGATYVVFNGAGGERRKGWEDLWKHLPLLHRGE
ncbi:CAP domain-containing protein [Methylacidimicrobium sp. B4]|uniref:CAP domain-containing protein n=1 Tax=Methylacidimicrobium sp. B4 TaxID=2796139 RepID=UPI001A90B35E|nr:CAP domain-containing protein [Methylacidimicrobium sp. B4]QSR83976.1 CAP domain-containing protein [Methylacidimicrobium sp. B4]